MSEKIVFTAMSAKIGDGQGLKKDEDGYYDVILGALNIHNSSGAYYECTDDVRKLFQNSSILMRRMEGGFLKAEQGHPKMIPGMKMRDFVSRIARIEEKSVCGHIKSITLTETNKRDIGSDVPVIVIRGKVKPMGPYASSLESDLSSKSSNTSFSIRSMTRDRIVNGKTIKTLANIITWDSITEPGLAIATKSNSITMESHDICSLDMDDLDAVNDITNDITRLANVSNESSAEILNDIKDTIVGCKSGNCLLNHWS